MEQTFGLIQPVYWDRTIVGGKLKKWWKFFHTDVSKLLLRYYLFEVWTFQLNYFQYVSILGTLADNQSKKIKETTS